MRRALARSMKAVAFTIGRGLTLAMAAAAGISVPNILGADRRHLGVAIRRLDHRQRVRRDRPFLGDRTMATPNNPRIGLARARMSDSGAVDHGIDCADGSCISDWRTICGGSSQPG